MKKYTKPTMEELVLETEDTITSSLLSTLFTLGNQYATAGKAQFGDGDAWVVD